MPGVPRSVRDLTTDYGPIGLVVMALDHVAIGIALGNNRTEGMYVTVVWASANGDRPTPVNSTQHRQVPKAPSFRIRSSNHLKRVDTPPAVPPNLRILPIPERALKQGWVIAQEWPAAVSGSGTALGAKLLRSRRGQQTARFGNRGLPAMDWHYWGPRVPPGMARRYRNTKKPRPRPGLLLKLVPEIGIEPTTYALRMRRSTN